MVNLGVIEDNLEFREELVFQLTQYGFKIQFEDDGTRYLNFLKSTKCDIVLLDLGLVGTNGTTVAKLLRNDYPHIGIIMITAQNSIDSKLTGLNSGADAYIIKPANLNEIAATIRSLNRRLNNPDQNSTVFNEKIWDLNIHTLKLITPNGDKIKLTAYETLLIKCLVEHSPHPASKKALAEAIGYSLNIGFDARRVEVLFSRLRKKINKNYAEGNIIQSARNLGYLFGATIRIVS